MLRGGGPICCRRDGLIAAMLCCAIAALGAAGAWGLHRLRLAGGLVLLAAAIAGGAAMMWDHAGPAGADRHAANAPASISLCLGARTAIPPLKGS
ncbi:hypothetical protein [Sphingomonas sp. KC8]|uniref:hypothetical protein n=1 Tax=Sphingomonas sp. KC8 TaxID=1030157 RepID=UPI0002489B63|nr:hypothetical protein [Sphingomonas sp. KC8]ARS28037.1 hypothetical protein KC8_12165 [Sphingomonas sp. KC8]